MTQHKAAALTSSLFARKGRASPASLLIADLEEAGPHRPTTGQVSEAAPEPFEEAANGPMNRGAINSGAIPVAALNGAAGRRKAKPQAAELPLLAFVEAQAAADAEGRADGAAESDPPEAETARRAAVVPQDELRPAASLLERPSPVLRRATDPAAAQAVDLPEPGAAGEGAAGRESGQSAAESGAAGPAADGDMQKVPETVSGDGNIAAIEDAPPDEPAAPMSVAPVSAAPVSAAPAPPVEVPEEVSGEAAEEAAAVAAQGETEAAPTAEADEKADTGIGEAVPTAAAMPRPVRPWARLRARSWVPTRVADWQRAAVVALGIALGLGAYVVISGEPVRHVTISGGLAPQAPPVAAPASGPAVSPAPEAAAGLPAEPPAQEAAIPASPAEAPLPEPSFDVIRIEPDGQSIIAGRALPFSEWILLNNGRPIASIRADANGEWVVLPDAALLPGANAFSLVPKTERGKVAIPAPSQEPAAASPGPRSEAMPVDAETTAVIALPKFKPEGRRPAVAIGVSPGGAYEVQVASVRQSADAARELARLTSAFPAPLGKLELRVQRASVEGAGTFYRVRSGAIEDLGAAREICRQLDAMGQGCLVVRRAAQSEPAPAEQEPEPAPLGTSLRQQAERPQ